MKTLQQLQRDFNHSTKEVQTAIKKNLPRLIGTEAVKLVKNNFVTQNYFGFGHWKKRKSSTDKAYMAGRGKGGSGRYKGSRFNANKPLLLQTRRLFRAIKFRLIGNGVSIGVDLGLVPYAENHNEGITKNMPKRQFIPSGNDPMPVKIRTMIEKEFNQEFDKALKLFKK